ncbi:MAG: CapA family protein [Ruminococcaceae bacterium]|nr:CapA family protein [Oscillospiraceae bacterium]
MITFLGDVALIAKDLKSEYKPAYPYVLNFEYVIGAKETYTPTPGKINLCAEDHDLASLFGAEPIAASLANNHIYDFGEAGYGHTEQILSEKGIGIIGAEPYVIGESVCLLSYMDLKGNSGFSFDYARAEADIARMKTEHPSAKIVVQMHWGIENHPNQTARQTEVGHWLIDHGADLVIGHHPHCIQPIEEYHGKFICYSLGNGLFGNINQPSHYDEKGVAKRKYRFKWRKWNRTSLAVTYDERTDRITVDKLYQKKNTLTCVAKDVPLRKYQGVKNRHLAKLVFRFRKYYLFLVSNSFVDGKLFDLNAFRSELRR